VRTESQRVSVPDRRDRRVGPGDRTPRFPNRESGPEVGRCKCPGNCAILRTPAALAAGASVNRTNRLSSWLVFLAPLVCQFSNLSLRLARRLLTARDSPGRTASAWSTPWAAKTRATRARWSLLGPLNAIEERDVVRSSLWVAPALRRVPIRQRAFHLLVQIQPAAPAVKRRLRPLAGTWTALGWLP
jgi:hypothetical protein